MRILILCLLIFYLNLIWRYHICVNSVLLPGYVCEMKQLDYIPEEYIMSKTFVDCNLQKPEVDYIKFFYEKNDTFKNMRGFLPTLKGNPYYTGGYYDGLEADLNFQSWNHNATYVHLKNIFTTYTSALLSINFEYFCLDPTEQWTRDHPSGMLLNIYDHVIALGNTQLTYYSHWYHDVLGPLTLFPDYIIKKSYIIINKWVAAPVETIFSFGVEEWQLLYLQKEEWIFAKNCYTTIPPPHFRHFGKMMRNLALKLRKYYQVENIKPINYFISNRRLGEYRYISNMYDVFLAINKTFYEKYKISYLQDPRDIKETAKTWASAKLIFLTTGSTCIKSLFMKEKSVMIIGLAEIMDNGQPLIAANNFIFTLIFRIEGMIQYERQTNTTIKIPLAINVFKIGAFCAEHGKWNNSETFHMI